MAEWEKLWRKGWEDETALKLNNVSYEVVPFFDYSKIDWKASEENCGRPTPVTQADVDDYEQAMQRGDRFPIPAVVKVGDKYVIVSGLTRTKAAIKAGRTGSPAWLITSPLLPHVHRLIGIMSNRFGSIRVGSSEALESGVYLVLNANLQDKEVADHLRINVHTLQAKVRAARLKSSIIETGSKYAGRSKEYVFKAVAKLEPWRKVCKEAVDAIGTCKLTEDDSRTFVKEILAKKSEAGMLSFIETFVEKKEEEERRAKSPKGQPRPSVSLPLREKWVRCVSGLRELILGADCWEDVQIVSGSEDGLEQQRRFDEVVEKVKSFYRSGSAQGNRRKRSAV